MTAFPVLAVSFFLNIIAIFFVICAVILILIVLIQKGKGGGLGAAFGGGLASGILGSKTDISKNCYKNRKFKIS